MNELDQRNQKIKEILVRVEAELKACKAILKGEKV